MQDCGYLQEACDSGFLTEFQEKACEVRFKESGGVS